jgi:hypothetical protein
MNTTGTQDLKEFDSTAKKLVTNSKKLLNSYIFDKVDVQITKLVHLSFLFSGQLGRGRVV